MITNIQIFNEQGFLTSDGKAFIKDGFAKELQKVLNTASNVGDVRIISCILKSLVGEMSTNHIGDLMVQSAKTLKPSLTLIKTEIKNNVIPFPGHKGLKELANTLTDIPPMDQD